MMLFGDLLGVGGKLLDGKIFIEFGGNFVGSNIKPLILSCADPKYKTFWR